MSKVLRIPTALYSPDRKLASIGITAVNEPGVLITVLEPIARRGINLLAIISSAARADAPTATVSMIIDVTGVEKPVLMGLLEEIRGNDKVVDAQIYETGIDGYAADLYHEEYSVFDLRIIMLSEIMFYGFLKFLYDRFGETAGAFLYYIGLGGGREIAKLHKSLFKDPETCLKVLSIQAHSFGYTNNLEIKKNWEDAYQFSFNNMMECSIVGGWKKGKTSNWFRGIAAGYLSELMGRECLAEEVKCVNDGDERCVFHVRRREDL